MDVFALFGNLAAPDTILTHTVSAIWSGILPSGNTVHVWHWFSDQAADSEETDMRNGKDGCLYFPVEKYLVNL